jgi:hypothetical protein
VDRQHAQPIRPVDQLGDDVQHAVQIDIGAALDIVVGDRCHGAVPRQPSTVA